MRILLAEDEQDLNRIITQKLCSDGYSVDSCHDGMEAMECLDCADYDAIILDVMMPKANGYEVLSHLRKKSIKTPVIFLTARDSVEDRVKGLDSGANDYMVKPFAFDELTARLRAIMRNSFGMTNHVLIVDDLSMDTASHLVKRGEKKIDLSAKEYALLEYLMHNAGIVLTREKIENHIWDFDYEGGTNVVDVYISYLRRKIDEGYSKKLIHTIRGKGYILRDDI